MLVATPLEDGTAHLDAEDVPGLPETTCGESIDSAVVKVVEIRFRIRGSRKYGNIRRQPGRWTHLGRRDVRAKENQDRRELQEKLFSKERVPVHDSPGSPVPQLRVSHKFPAPFCPHRPWKRQHTARSTCSVNRAEGQGNQALIAEHTVRLHQEQSANIV
jgi:hypothetical protein